MAFPPLSLLLQFAAKDEFGNFPRSTVLFSFMSENTIITKPAVRYCARLRRPKTTLVRAIHWRSHIFYFRGASRGEIISESEARRDGRIITIIIFRMTPTAFIPAIHPVEESGVGATRQAPMDGGEDNGDAKKTVAAPDGRRRQTKAALALDAFVSRPGVDVHTWTTPVAAEFGMRRMDLNERKTFCRFCIRREVTNTHWETCSSPSAAISLLLPSMGLALCVRTFHQCTSHAVWPKKQKGYSMPRVRRAEKIALCSLVSPVVIGYGYRLGRKLRQTSFTIVKV